MGGALAAVTLLLVALGSGIGLSSVSRWTALNPSATTFTLLAAVWLIIVQWLSSELGGYTSGRLRTKWASLHTDEVFFRDTVHGFLALALASVLVVAFATSSISSAVSSAGRAISNFAGSAASTATQAATNQSSCFNGYFVDAEDAVRRLTVLLRARAASSVVKQPHRAPQGRDQLQQRSRAQAQGSERTRVMVLLDCVLPDGPNW